MRFESVGKLKEGLIKDLLLQDTEVVGLNDIEQLVFECLKLLRLIGGQVWKVGLFGEQLCVLRSGRKQCRPKARRSDLNETTTVAGRQVGEEGLTFGMMQGRRQPRRDSES